MFLTHAAEADCVWVQRDAAARRNIVYQQSHACVWVASLRSLSSCKICATDMLGLSIHS
jgi:hypothetical protein